jgi:hypothetical protein
MPVIDWACAFLSKFSSGRRRFQPPDLERLNPEDLKLLKGSLKGVRVTVTVPAGGRRPARPIKDLHPDAGNYAFMKGDEETTIKVCSVISLKKLLPTRFQDYYNEKYGFRLRFPRLFGIVVNVQQKTIVPVEICTIVGGQMYKKTLFPEQMSELLQHVTKNPRERIEAIERGVQGDVSFRTLGFLLKHSPNGPRSSSTTKTLPFSLRSACKSTSVQWKPPLACFSPPISSTKVPEWTSLHNRIE